jgi:putative transposase
LRVGHRAKVYASSDPQPRHIGREVDQVRQMKQLQEENTRLKQLVAELSLDKTMLQDVLRKKF